jgi:hypothetical protein
MLVRSVYLPQVTEDIPRDGHYFGTIYFTHPDKFVSPAYLRDPELVPGTGDDPVGYVPLKYEMQEE